MKCPKCSYLSFEPELRCKHCGYDFSLAEPDLPVRAYDELEQQDPNLPMVDLQLRPTAAEDRPAPALGLMMARPRPEPAPALRRGAAAVALAEREAVTTARPAPTPLAAVPSASSAAPRDRRPPVPTAELPLFITKGVSTPGAVVVDPARARDEPAVQVPAAPRPLVVRRRAPDSGRQAGPAAVPATPALAINRADRDLLEYLRRVETEAAPAAFPSPTVAASRSNLVTPAMRLEAAAIDVLVLVALNVGVVWMTLRQCDLGVSQLAVVPVVPLATFLVSLSLGYLLMFTVIGGQTIGKMLLGLRVVADVARDSAALEPTSKQMSYRALLTVPSVLILGLGFLPALLGEGLAVHDRLTHTRVVRA